jgi:hypothetical protein
MSNKNLFQEAIADAKSVREAALANAKAALEEALTPRLQSMLAAKLNEMDYDEAVDDIEDAEMEEGFSTNQFMFGDEDNSETDQNKLDEELDLDEILAELEMEEEGKKKKLNKGGHTGPLKDKDEKSTLDTAKNDTAYSKLAEAKEDEESEEEEEVEVKDMTVEELKDLIKDIVNQEIEAEEAEGPGAEAEEEEHGGEEMGAEEEEINLDELLAELDSMGKDEEMEEGILGKIGGAIKKGAQNVGYALGKSPKECEDRANAEVADAVAQGWTKAEAMEKFYWQEINACRKEKGLGPLTSYTGPGTLASRYEAQEMEEGIMSKIKGAIRTGAEKLGAKNPPECDQRGQEIMDLAKSKGITDPGNLDTLKWMAINECRQEKGLSPLVTHVQGRAFGVRESKELKEAVSVINTLRSELNEVNLLNAKLLYVNKIFKAKNLSESQKVQVIASFDKASTIREAKVVFESLNTALTPAKKAIKESIGFASKAAGIAPQKQQIVESNDAITRMQKLANIIK